MSIHHLSGHTFGQYELRELLGVGGMGAVYRGYQLSLKRAVAIKVLSAELAQDAGHVERFNREAETSARLEHRHIIPIHDYGIESGISYVVMRLLTGGTLAERIEQTIEQEQKLPSLGETADLLRQLASGLDYAHSQDVVHRDIKPSNIMFDNQGSAYIVDFGIAKLLQAAHALTGTGMTMGTPTYMAPEQWKAEEIVAATDQYALGIMTYALVTGQVPFEAATPYALMHKHLNETPVLPQALRSDIPDTVNDVVNRAISKGADERFPTCTAFAQAFTKAISGQVGETTSFFTVPVARKSVPVLPQTPPALDPDPMTVVGDPSLPPIATPVGSTESPSRWRIWAAGAVVVTLIALMGVMLLGGGGDEDDEPPTSTVMSTIDDTLTPLPSPDVEGTANALVEVRLTETAISLTLETEATLTHTPEPTLTLTLTSIPEPTLTLTQTLEPTPEPTVEPNAPPVIERLAAKVVIVGETLSVPVVVTDPDGDPVEMRVKTNNDAVVAVALVGSDTVELTGLAVGSTTVTLTAIDARKGSDSVMFFVTVMAPEPTPEPTAEPNDPPVIERLAAKVVIVGETLSVPVVVTDPDGDSVEMRVKTNNEAVVAVALVGSDTVELTGLAEGSTTVMLTAIDARRGSDSVMFFVTVVAPEPTPEPTAEPNDPPFIERMGGKVLTVSETLSVPVVVTDPDDDPVEMTVRTNNDQVVTVALVGSDTVELTGLAEGSTLVTLAASDGRGGRDSVMFFVTVTQAEAGDAP